MHVQFLKLNLCWSLDHKTCFFFQKSILSSIDGKERRNYNQVVRKIYFYQNLWSRATALPYLYYKSWNNWKQFSPKLGPPYLSRRTHLSDPEFWRKGVETHFLIEAKCFYQNPNTFYTKHFHLPTLVPTYYFPLFVYQATIIFW